MHPILLYIPSPLLKSKPSLLASLPHAASQISKSQMGPSLLGSTAPLLLLILAFSSMHLCLGSRRLTSLYQPPPTLLKYHNGELLEGVIPISIVWYGKFTTAQKSIISDFLLSLTPQPRHELASSSAKTPFVHQWWKTVDELVEKAGGRKTTIVLSNQISYENYSMGKSLARSQLSELVMKAGHRKGGLVVVLTAEDVVVEGFCMSHCGLHSSMPRGGPAYLWVGNSASQCPGQCAWPFHQPIYGPQTPPLVPPNGDVGFDGMVINVATLLAGTVTNPNGAGYFQGDAGAPVEVAAVCPGVYGKGAYPGYAGELLVDPSTGASYNVVGKNGRKYLVPAMYDPSISACSPMV